MRVSGIRSALQFLPQSVRHRVFGWGRRQDAHAVEVLPLHPGAVETGLRQ